MQETKWLTKGIVIKIRDIDTMVFGGRFKDYQAGTRRLIGIKMARELDYPCDISIPTADYSIPSKAAMVAGMVSALLAARKGNDIYVGCMGGIGRTGLFMGCIAKLAMDMNGGTYDGFNDPVRLVRTMYMGHAIETDQQMDFVRNFDTSEVLLQVWPEKVQLIATKAVQPTKLEQLKKCAMAVLSWPKK